MSQLTSLFQSLRGSLHHGPSMEPLWDQVVKEIVALEQDVAKLKEQMASSVQGLDPELVEDLKVAHAEHKARMKDKADALAALNLAKEMVKPPVPQEAPVQVIDATTLAADADKAPPEVIGGPVDVIGAESTEAASGEQGKPAESETSSS